MTNMKKILISQIVVLVIVSILSGVLSGLDGILSALLGGVVYIIPSFFSVLLLKFFNNTPQVQGKAFIIGEVLKVVLSLVLMLLVFVFWHHSLVFIPFLLGLLSVSHLVFLVFLRVKDYGK